MILIWIICINRPYWNVIGMGDVLEQVAAVSDQMVQYSLHREELLLLQATVLVNAGKSQICYFYRVKMSRDARKPVFRVSDQARH